MKNSRKIELLAPAGGSESLHAAVENGADAVYLGGKLFNARQNAGNFDMQELQSALEYAHVRGVRIYLAMNTLIADNEMKEAGKFAGNAWEMGIDGIIVQDIGFAGWLGKKIPGIPLHASTQMTIYNLGGIKFLEKMGFKRVVLARELPLDEIKKITAGTPLEVEIFIHGALCISYSGQCLMSGAIGGRSGNRGKCAQPCRLPYKLVNNYTTGNVNGNDKPRYLLSPKDMCSLNYLGDIVSAGVTALKIEGRMKSPEYVATVVRIYRKYLDMVISGKNGPIDECDLTDLAQIFNRGGFSNGYLYGKTGKDMMCFEKPKNWGIYIGDTISYDSSEKTVKVKMKKELSTGDGIEIWNGEEESPGTIVTYIRKSGTIVKSVDKDDTAIIGYVSGKIPADCKVYKTSDKHLTDAARATFQSKPLKRVKLKGLAILKAGEPFKLKAYDNDGNIAAAESISIPEIALNKPLTSERIDIQLRKTGQTPFEFSEIDITVEENLSVPVGEINETRRKALEILEQKRAEPQGERFACTQPDQDYDRVISGIKSVPMRHFTSAVKIALYFYCWDNSRDYAAYSADRIYLPLVSLLDSECRRVFDTCRANGIEVFIWLPTVTWGNYERLIRKELIEKGNRGIDGILAGNPGILEMAKQMHGMRVTGDHTLNLFNRYSLYEAASMRLEGAAFSTELTLDQVCSMNNDTGLIMESIVYGKLPLITSEYCPAGSIEGGFSSTEVCNCKCKNTNFRLKDRMGAEFTVICDSIDCRSTILNSTILFIPDALKKLKDFGTDIFRLYIWDETPTMIKSLVKLHRDIACGGYDSIPENKGLIDQMKSGGFTKGHYYRTV